MKGWQRRTRTDEKGVVLVAALWLMALLTVMGTSALVLARVGLKTAHNYKTYTQALYYTEGAAEAAIQLHAFTGPGTITWDSSHLAVGGMGQVIITHDVTDPDLAHLVSTFTYHGSTVSLILILKRTPSVLAGVRAALTTNGPTAVNGGMVVDGRDHDLNGVVISNAGMNGVSSGSTFEQDARSTIGGTLEGLDVEPSNPAEPGLIEENLVGLPQTPDEVMTLTEGTLKNFALSGQDGSQYTTDPRTLTTPLSGVTYVEMPIDDPEWILGGDDILIDGTGVLVITNSAGTAVVKNVNRGTFRGLVIADDIVHIHNVLIGAVVSLTPNPSEGNVIGNGNGRILFSSAALNGLSFIQSIRVIAWREML